MLVGVRRGVLSRPGRRGDARRGRTGRVGLQGVVGVGRNGQAAAASDGRESFVEKERAQYETRGDPKVLNLT